MPSHRVGFAARIRLALQGKRHYLAVMLPLIVYKRYGFQKYYSKAQIQFSVDALGHKEYFDKEIAWALLATPQDSVSIEKYQEIRTRYGLQNGGALEVLRVYGNIEKTDSDPFGSHQASDTAGGRE